MSIRQNITKDDGLFIGRKKVLNFENLVVKDISSGYAFTFHFMDKTRTTTHFTKTGTISEDGSGADEPIVQVVIDASDTAALTPSNSPEYWYCLSETDTEEDIVAEGSVVLQDAPALS